ncbi:MAG: DNA polymerase I [Anaerolineae bacterium]|nr:DNA polymerase I [Anaerolineae bacterium]
MPKDELVLIDGHALAYRMYYALPVESFTTREGEATNASFGFTRLLLDILVDQKPKYLAVAFDAGMSGRDEVFPDYKGTREKSPDDLKPQVERIHKLLEAFNVPTLELPGWEADDIIGTIAPQAEAKGVDVRILTGDRDLLQLVTERTTVQLPGRQLSDIRLYDLARFREEYGLEPPQLVDLKGFIGDKSDNIPGVFGIGEKGATKLLQEYGSLDDVYAHIDEIKGALKTKLEEGRDDAYLSKQLATIRRDAPITLDLAKCVAEDYDREPVAELFRQLEFRSLIDRLPKQAEPVGEQLALFAPEAAPTPAAEREPPPEGPTQVTVVDTEEKLAALVKKLEAAKAITVDVESTSTDQMAAALVGIAITPDEGEGYYIPVGHKTDDAQLPLAQVMDALRPPMTDPEIPKYGHNIKYDYVVLRRHGLDIAPIAFDTMVAEWLRDPSSRNLGLKNLAWAVLNVEMTPIDRLIGSGRNQITMAEVPVAHAATYAAADVDMTHRLVDVLTPDLHEKKAWDLMVNLEMPLIPVLADMETHGVLLDTDFLAGLSAELGTALEKLEREIYAIVGYDFNVNSTQQLSDALFGKLGLPAAGVRKTSSGHFSTASDVLDSLQKSEEGHHEILGLILEHRELSKLKGTYVDALPQLVNPETGRVHTSFNQTGTVTGRISSSDPNLQNIPIRTETGAQVRKAFIAQPGWTLLECDYSQVELRILAHMSDDPGLKHAFQQGFDIHAATAAVIYDKPMNQVTKRDRNFAKRVNFGLIYGMTPFRLARETDLSVSEAERFVKAYFGGFPNVKGYLDSTISKAKKQGYVETLMGRRRYFPVLQTDARDQQRASVVARQRAEREAINMPIQGTAADIIKIAMIDLHHELRAKGLQGRMILQVHDALVLEAPEEELEETAALVRTVMESAYTDLTVPLKVDANAGPNWFE